MRVFCLWKTATRSNVTVHSQELGGFKNTSYYTFAVRMEYSEYVQCDMLDNKIETETTKITKTGRP